MYAMDRCENIRDVLFLPVHDILGDVLLQY
jgi:hypothetical protein